MAPGAGMTTSSQERSHLDDLHDGHEAGDEDGGKQELVQHQRDHHACAVSNSVGRLARGLGAPSRGVGLACLSRAFAAPVAPGAVTMRPRLPYQVVRMGPTKPRPCDQQAQERR